MNQNSTKFYKIPNIKLIFFNQEVTVKNLWSLTCGRYLREQIRFDGTLATTPLMELSSYKIVSSYEFLEQKQAFHERME